jgi:hypothetical protein
MDELRILAEALCQAYVEEYTSGGGRDFLQCRLCFREVPNAWETLHNPEAIDHKPDCPVLMAKAILTRQNVPLPAPRTDGRSFNFDD